MSTMRIIGMIACFSLAISAARAAESEVSTDQHQSSVAPAPVVSLAPEVAVHKRLIASQVRPHDRLHPTVRVAHVVPKEAGSAGVVRLNAEATRVATVQQVAGLDTPGSACDSILCPGYAILGVGF